MDNSIAVKHKSISSGMMLLLAAACGLIVANLYYSQTLIGPISDSIGLPSGAAGLIVTLTQIGYVIGLLFIVPLSDMLENRRLIVVSLAVVVLALIGAAFSTGSATFLTASLLIGSGSVVAQVLVPLAAFLSTEEQRGRVVGNVMSGLLLGIMLARPVASLLAGIWAWQTIFVVSSVLMTLLAIVLARVLPERRPNRSLSYRSLVASLLVLFKQTPILRRRAFYQACLFGSFSLFWTTVPLRLADEYGMSQQHIALFAFVGVAGAVAAPVAGRLADRNWSKPLTIGAILIAILSFLLIALIHDNSAFSLVLLFVAAITLDMAVSGNLVVGQRAIYSLGSETRGRLNGLFMAIFFLGGAAGSFLGGLTYAHGGWALSSWIGVLFPVLALLYFLTEWRSKA
ncbi:MFS transporter [Paenibacillus sacheonensis]|uniref:MFS transporter n=1 Tax=Paenibacillus sacheonensis TaxID=742054 RepID=A0A7X4YQD5_9BACL|nr:MFS transporter [Paenibacillus sacheonensis]MBM7566385.1 putative MFS family arabinose efflux permease [Paenibacillus sacheonensis]NBC70587.1 MFS transporter [Paenibacillus sacheonensis]